MRGEYITYSTYSACTLFRAYFPHFNGTKNRRVQFLYLRFIRLSYFNDELLPAAKKSNREKYSDIQ